MHISEQRQAEKVQRMERIQIVLEGVIFSLRIQMDFYIEGYDRLTPLVIFLNC